MEKILKRVFFAEIGTFIFATVVFRLVEPKVWAAIFTGTAFVTLGIAILLIGLRHPEFRKTLTFPIGLVHLFVTSLPLFIMRIVHFSDEFRDIQVFGVPGRMFHHIAEMIYMALLVATVIDRLRLRFRTLAAAKSHPGETKKAGN